MENQRQEFDSQVEKPVSDAHGIVENVDPINFDQSADDDISTLRAAIAKEQGAVSPELSPEQQWLGQLQARFNFLEELHKGVQWIDVEKSLKADPESMRKLQALDEKGHSMNVFGEENGEFIFASAWNNFEQVSVDHRNIVFDKKAQDYLKRNFPNEMCNGNATDIAKALGVDLADPKAHEQLISAIQVNGWAWLKTDEAKRKLGSAFCGGSPGVYGADAYLYGEGSSFRAALRVKKVA